MNKLLCLYLVLWLAVGYIKADHAGEGHRHPGPCACTALWDPVCGEDEKTYSNAGCAECAKVGVVCKGECPCIVDDCICILLLAPVCGVDEVQYDNECLAGCAGIPVDCHEKCPCPCPEGIVNCFADPCDVEKCPAYPDAQCFSNYCGGCNAVFVANGEVVNCDLPQPDPPNCIEQDKECNAFNTDFPEKDELECCDGLKCCPDCVTTHGGDEGGGSLSIASVYGTCKHSCHC